MSVYQHKNGRWYYKFYIKGEQFHKSIPEATEKKEALAAEISIKRELLRGNYDVLTENKFVPFSKVCDEFEEYAKVNRKKSYNNIDKYYIQNFKDYFKGGVNKITTADIENYKKKFVEKNQSCTINRRMSCLKSLFSLAVVNKHIKESPCTGVKKLKEEKRPDRFLSIEEEKKLLEQCTGYYEYMRGIVICAIYTGMRPSEILNLKWDNINFEENFMHLLVTKTLDRKIPISKKLLKELEVLPRSSEYVFTNSETLSKYYSIKRAYNKILGNSGIKPIRFYDLRHTAATRMVASGIDITVVGEILGHTQIKTTARYAHPVPERKLKAIEALDDYGIPQNGKESKQSKYSRKFIVKNSKTLTRILSKPIS